MSKDNIKTSGTCQACFGSFAIRNERMVLHGYQRPGIGYTIGKCWGVNELPYELDCEVTKAWRAQLLTLVIPGERKRREATVNATELVLHVQDFSKPYDYRLRAYPTKVLVFVKGVKSEHDLRYSCYTFESVQTNKLAEIDRGIKDLEKLVTELDRRIETWVYAPERLVKEERKQQLLHASRGGNQAWAAVCRNSYRARGNGPLVTQNPEKVTCPKCKVYAERKLLIAESKAQGDIKAITVRA
jgi:hypothetical protein